MRADVLTAIAAVAAAAAAVAAVVSVVYARAAARAGRETVAAARRTVVLAESSRRSAERARVRGRVERVGELVQAISTSSLTDAGAEVASQLTRGQCNLLRQAVVGLKELLPKSAAVHLARSPGEINRRAAAALVEIDGVLAGFARRRPVYRHRRPSRTRTSRRQSLWPR